MNKAKNKVIILIILFLVSIINACLIVPELEPPITDDGDSGDSGNDDDNTTDGDDPEFESMIANVYPGLDIYSHYHFKDLVHGMNPTYGLENNMDVMNQLQILLLHYKNKITDERDNGEDNNE